MKGNWHWLESVMHSKVTINQSWKSREKKSKFSHSMASSFTNQEKALKDQQNCTCKVSFSTGWK